VEILPSRISFSCCDPRPQGREIRVTGGYSLQHKSAVHGGTPFVDCRDNHTQAKHSRLFQLAAENYSQLPARPAMTGGTYRMDCTALREEIRTYLGLAPQVRPRRSRF